jgi:hypothetical protein
MRKKKLKLMPREGGKEGTGCNNELRKSPF